MIFEMQVITAFLNSIKELKIGDEVTFRTKDDVFTIKCTEEFFEIKDNVYDDGELVRVFIEFSHAVNLLKRFVEK